ncbi:TIGR01458 family HAD-type hydrolase [Desulfuromonas carbonis]|uniref:TIGR01458 family HAD-type hydrolase n=1 Tax=Desulfuromonas sp. DDH964 TaxID=1823759 RepID=UPI00078EC255|nr:TIGR01458 family HAD-type hydrolase [Desulfuromonas sp. DDH964]AMV71470.1 putative hydrolase YutF [Desulfuromonas sp. DDH964]
MQALLFDLDGVIYQAREPIPGAREALAWVREQGIPHLFVTNTTSRPLSWLQQRLRQMEIPASADQILTPARVARRWLARRTDGPIALFVPDRTLEDFAGIPLHPHDQAGGAAAVVIGNCGKAWDFSLLNSAFLHLMAAPAAPLVALGVPRYWQGPEGLRLDAGPFVAALEYATGRKAVVLGKPSADFYQTALEILGTPPERTVMVGDDIRADVDGAQRLGIRGLLVRTGKFLPADLQEGIVPEAVLESIADLPAWWRER